MANKKREPRTWNVDSWKSCKTLQQPEYPDKQGYRKVLQTIAAFPPLVSTGEIENLRKQTTEAAEGKRFILQGGDCAEQFADCTPDNILNKIKILLEMSVILTYGARKPVVRIGRLSGQFAKPRSSVWEMIDGKKIPSYRGDIINTSEPDPAGRIPDPERLLQAFFNSAVSLNYIRAMIDGGFADLHHPDRWNLHSMERSLRWKDYRHVTDGILDAISFMESFGGLKPESLGRVDYFTSHEGLHLGYESALTRRDPNNGKVYNQGAHMLWIGERTRGLSGGHVEYFRGIANPIGIKFGPGMRVNELLKLLDILDPQNEPGRITLISRLGYRGVTTILPSLIKAVARVGRKPAWSCDPMHGNTTVTKDGHKTRNFEHVLEELKRTFLVHKTGESYLAGVHFELTGENVTECTGGADKLRETDLSKNYVTTCDPRLNYSQSLEIAFQISLFLKKLYP